MQKHFIAQNQSRIINCKRCLYLYPDIYPSPFSREYHTGKYWFLNKSKSSNLLIINPAEIAQLVSLERRSLFRPWSSNPCQGWGREFESRFPLQAGQHIAGLLFLYKGLGLAPRSPRELPAGPAEGTTKEVAPCPRTRARVSFSAPSGSAYSWPAFFYTRDSDSRPAPRGSCRPGRQRGLRKKSRHARVRGLESRFPLHAGQR